MTTLDMTLDLVNDWTNNYYNSTHGRRINNALQIGRSNKLDYITVNGAISS